MQGYFLAITKVVDLFSALLGTRRFTKNAACAFQNPLTGIPDFQFEKPRMLSVLVLLKSLRIRNLLLAPLLNGFVVIKSCGGRSGDHDHSFSKGPFLDDFDQRFGSSIPIPSSIVAYHSVDSTIVESMLLVLGKSIAFWNIERF